MTKVIKRYSTEYDLPSSVRFSDPTNVDLESQHFDVMESLQGPSG